MFKFFQTTAAVKRFQKRHALGVDGILGTNSFAQLNRSWDDRADQIALGFGSEAAHDAALAAAADNGAEVTSCECDGLEVEIAVTMARPTLMGIGAGTVTSTARARQSPPPKRIRMPHGRRRAVFQSMTNVDTRRSAGMTNSVSAAIIVCSIIPILLIYPFLQKYFSKGILLGGVKE